MLSIIIILSIALAIFLGYRTKINTGLFCIVFAYIIGCFVMGLKPKQVIAFWPICMKQLLTVLPPVFLMFLWLFFINYGLIYFLFFFLVSFQYQKTKKRTRSTTKESRVRFSFSYLFYSSNATRSVELVQV